MKKTVKLTSLLLCLMMLVSSVAAVPAFTASAQEPGAVYDWIEPWQIPIASVYNDGSLSVSFINDGVTNNTSNTWTGGKAEGYMDYYGYRFVNTYTVDSVVFTSGKMYGDGGYFAESPVIRVLQNGVWNKVESQISPDYDAKEYTDYTFTFEPVACDGIMVYGAAGGSAHFISCAELKVRAQIEEKNALELTRYEFERYAADVTAGGKITVQNMDYLTTDSKMWSRGYQLLWKRTAEDKELSFDFRVMADGEYNVNLLLTKANDFGSFTYSIDGTQIGDGVDSKSSAITPVRINELGKIKLTAGIHTFKITALSETAGKLLGGFDAFELEKVSDSKWIQYESVPVASVTRTGVLALNHINDGNYGVFTNLYSGGKTRETLDWVGYTFDDPQTVTELRYTEGKYYSDGGWFREAPVIKVMRNGEWQEIESVITPEYDTNAATEWQRYSFTFEPVKCEGIIVSGKPGGDAKFISCGEIEVRAKTDNGQGGEDPRPEPEITYSYGDIVKRLYDMEAIAKTPSGERSAEITSRDRASAYDAANDTYVNWGANADWTGYIRKQSDGGYVIAELEGPGYINQIWMAHKWTGNVRIYIDGSDTPAVDQPIINMFNGTMFPYDQLSYRSTPINENMSAFNCYVPIPYNKSCKVVLYNSADNRFGDFSYYNIGYTTLPETCAVESFTYPLSDEQAAALKTANDVLSDRDAVPSDGKPVSRTVTVKPGETASAAKLTGSGAINFLEVSAKLSEDSAVAAKELSNIVMKMYWDGSEQPAVYTALGDFFGSSNGLVPFESYVSGVRGDGTMYARWYMPYSDGAEIAFENRNETDKELTVTVYNTSADSDADYARFGAQWNRLTDREKKDDRWPDCGYFYAEGVGRYVGVSLHLYQISDGIWWGEGDEKFFIDGEKMPSWFGTGSEDYFGYAWCQAQIFNEAFHGQPLCEGARGTEQLQDAGNKINYRYHVVDNIPFYESFDANIEKYFNDNSVVAAATTFYYLDSKSSADYKVPQFTADERDFNRIPDQKAALFYEGEDILPFITENTGGSVAAQDMGYAETDTRKWSGHAHLWWKSSSSGQRLSFTVNIPYSGEYSLNALLTGAGDYGKIKLYLDGKPIGESFDCYSPELSVMENNFGSVELTAGEHLLTVECDGKADSSTGYFLGIDYIEFKPLQLAVSDITLDRETADMTVGEKLTLTAAVVPDNATNKKIKWSSSDTAVVSVDENGNITALKAGTAVITAASEDNGSAARSCVVTVTEKIEIIMGDVDNNGVVNVSDIITLKGLIMSEKWSEEQLIRGDIDGNQTLNVSDMLSIKSIIMNS